MKRRRALLLAARAAALAAALSAVYVLWLPDVEPLKKSNPKTTSFIVLREMQAARRGKPFKKTMIWAPFERISEHLRHAVVTAEDDMFFKHDGIDWEAVRVALRKDWEMKRLAYGASTITQQVARNLYLSPSKNPLRKIKEALIARRLERVLGKRRILELYLNIAEWGKGIYGAEAASRAYFGKSASELTADEAVALAVVLPNPRRWKPVGPSRYVARNSRRIIERMRASGLLPEEAPAQAPVEAWEIVASSAADAVEPWEVSVAPRPGGAFEVLPSSPAGPMDGAVGPAMDSEGETH